MTAGSKLLAHAALDARKLAYCAYSRFAVGAALLCRDGKIYKGANIENASFGATICAERAAFSNAICDGALMKLPAQSTDFKKVEAMQNPFVAIAIAGGKEGDNPVDFCSPCGICRQVMLEFCMPDFQVFLVKSFDEVHEFTLDSLLPHAFQGKEILEVTS